MPFEYVPMIDAVGMLFQEAAVKAVDSQRAGDCEKSKIFMDAAMAIKEAWPDLVKQSLYITVQAPAHLPEVLDGNSTPGTADH